MPKPDISAKPNFSEKPFPQISGEEIKAYLSRVNAKADILEAKTAAVKEFLQQEDPTGTNPKKDPDIAFMRDALAHAQWIDDYRLWGKGFTFGREFAFGGLTATARRVYSDERESFKRANPKASALRSVGNAVGAFFKGVRAFFVNIPASLGQLIKINQAKLDQEHQTKLVNLAFEKLNDVKLTRAKSSIKEMAVGGVATPRAGHAPGHITTTPEDAPVIPPAAAPAEVFQEPTAPAAPAEVSQEPTAPATNTSTSDAKKESEESGGSRLGP